MARDDQPSPIRRIMMQWIMWVILGLTVVAAATVNQFKRQTLRPVLHEQIEFRGVTVRLPGGWVPLTGQGNEHRIVRGNPQVGDVLVFEVRPRGFRDMAGLSQSGPGERATFVREIDVGGQPERLMLHRWIDQDREPFASLLVARVLPRARILSISIIVPGAVELEELGPEIDLIQRIAASVEVDADY